MSCIFCKEPLDGSDEHIIPDSLNGKMHSKRIICHNCNSNIFGKHVDPVGKDFFNPLLLAFQFKNARSSYVYDANGDQFLLQRDGSIKKVKPELIKTKVGSQTRIQITGDPKDVIRLFNKEKARLIAKGKLSVGSELKEIASDQAPFKSEKVFELVPKLKLLYNKIALEYLGYRKLDLSKYNSLLDRVKSLDRTLNNIYFCNNEFEIRSFKMEELTHLIKPMIIDNNLIVYH